MFATRLRCVSITPLDMPVVPLENGSAARSAAGSTGGAPGSPPLDGSDSSANTLRGRPPRPRARSGSATITARAPALCSCVAISSAVSSGLIGVTIAPSEITAWYATAHAGVFGASSPTASPGPMPSAASPAADRADALGELGVGRDGAARAVDQRGLVARARPRRRARTR